MRRFSLDSLITRLEKFVACPWLVLEYFFFIIIFLLRYYFTLFYGSHFLRGLIFKKKFFLGKKKKECMKGDSLKKFLVLKDGANFFLKD